MGAGKKKKIILKCDNDGWTFRVCGEVDHVECMSALLGAFVTVSNSAIATLNMDAAMVKQLVNMELDKSLIEVKDDGEEM